MFLIIQEHIVIIGIDKSAPAIPKTAVHIMSPNIIQFAPICMLSPIILGVTIEESMI